MQAYGMTNWRDLFTDRQLVALGDLLRTSGSRCASASGRDAVAAGVPDDSVPLRDSGVGLGATAYAEAVGLYLASRCSTRVADQWLVRCAIWDSTNAADVVQRLQARQAIQMIWNFAEANVFSASTQHWLGQVEWVATGNRETSPATPASETHFKLTRHLAAASLHNPAPVHGTSTSVELMSLTPHAHRPF